MVYRRKSVIDQIGTRRGICQVGRWMAEKGMVGGRDGNISVRLEDGRILCTPTEMHKGAMEPADIALLDAEGRQINGRRPVTSEVRLHLHIYRACADVAAVVHAHPPHASAFAVAGKAPPGGVMPEVELSLGPVALAKYETPGTDAVAQSVTPHLTAGARAVLMSNHGAVTVAEDLLHAWWRMETLERYCQVILLSGPLGGPRPLAAGKLAKLLDLKRRRSSQGDCRSS